MEDGNAQINVAGVELAFIDRVVARQASAKRVQ
jgi:hypothetical protein